MQATEDQPHEIEDIYWEAKSDDLINQESRNGGSYRLVTHCTHAMGSEVKTFLMMPSNSVGIVAET